MIDFIPNDPLRGLLTNFYKAHGVVDYLTIRPESNESPLEDVHRKVALFGMRVIDWRTREFFKIAEKQRHLVFYRLFWCGLRFHDLSSTSFTHLKIDEAIMKSSAEDAASFMESYRYAFFEPPYNLSVKHDEAERLFVEINRTLLGDLNRWTIRKWSNDWSSYFDLGKDWWGSFLWTLTADDAREAIWIGASTTD